MSKANRAQQKTDKGAEIPKQRTGSSTAPEGKGAEIAQQRTGRSTAPGGAARTAGREGSQLATRGRSGIAPRSTASPFSFMRRFSEEMDRLFDDFGFGGLGPSFGPALAPRGLGALSEAVWSPQVEMFEREGKLIVRADLPGLTKDDVKVDLDDDAITIQGERKREHEENREGYYRSERSYGSFYRSIPLPEGVSGEDAKATFRDGVLEIAMEAPKRNRGRRLQIEEGPEAM